MQSFHRGTVHPEGTDVFALHKRRGPIVTICGSRGIDRMTTENILDGIDKCVNLHDGGIITGGARGVDTWAKQWANNHGIDNKVIPADWDTHGKKAGYIRNFTMVSISQMVIAIWDGESKGTKHTIDICLEQKKTLIVVVVNDGDRQNTMQGH